MKPFKRSLYEEHLEEASFLHEHRTQALLHPAYDVDTLADLDARLEAHLDGLVLGGELALELCQEREANGDVGELHAAFSVYCRHRRADLVAASFEAADEGDDERLAAMRDAAAREMPLAFAPYVSEWVVRLPSSKSAVLAHATAVQRLDLGSALIRGAQQAAERDIAPFLRAIGRTCASNASMLLYKHMQVGTYEGARDAAIAGLMLGDDDLGGYLAREAGHSAWAAVALALTATRVSARMLERFLPTEDDAANDALLALGLLGDRASAEVLVRALSSKALSSHAAAALYLMTGVALAEEGAVAPSKGPNPKPPGEGAGAGSSLPRDEDEDVQAEAPISPLSTSCEAWSDLLRDRAEQLAGARNLRAGRAYDPLSTLSLLRAGYLPMQGRRQLVDELAIRHRIHVCDFTELAVPTAWASFACAQAELTPKSGRSRSAHPIA